ncbi:hypothetical protein NQ315_011501 [Exocentrus adspersus]|uniref:Aminopeptidase P N-terminal domain-containing protein n=1 Tax=Exocentrus adspersus TaxID=1586481 RepID=A0AAV8VV80_9CUCU|nr:hypothetical protein NQ315_011501 [Exocentrus adspersus]
MFVKLHRFLKPFTSDLSRKYYCINAPKSKIQRAALRRSFGQPTFETHPHLLREGEVTPFITKSEYQDRRCNLVTSILESAATNNEEKTHVIIVPGASKQYMSDKIPYVFRQNTEFLYLTGCQEPDCCMIITVAPSGEYHTVLFTRDKDEHAELWDGPRTHPEQAPDFFRGRPEFAHQRAGEFFAVVPKIKQMLSALTNIHSIVTNYLSRGQKKCENPRSFIHRLRLYKSTAEIALMQKSCDITAQAFAETMACSKPYIGENQIFAKIDYECRMRGAEYLAYPPVVAGGSRATTIHYINNNQIINNGELVLVDAGCEYHGYSSDVTRTWPINGKFTPQQREIYELVYCVQEELIQLCNSFPTLDALFEAMCRLLGKRLQEIGLVGIQPSNDYLMKAAYQLCPHHVSHYLGMDIHDTPTVNRNIKIAPGMIITVEPGIYISERNKNIPKEYHGIGIRIEDDVLITVNGPVVLSRKCPKHIDDIEKIVCQNQ